MADLSDVEAAIAAFVGATLYPSGNSGACVVAALCMVERGWPNAISLNEALAAGNVVVSIYAQQFATRPTSRFQMQWQTVVAVANTLTATTSGDTVTIGGAVSASPQTVVIAANSKTWAYTALANDTPTTIAAALAALVTGSIAIGATVTLAGASGLAARVSGVGTIARELRRQTQGFQVIVWAPTPALRDSVASLIDVSFAEIDSLVMPDGFGARIQYARTMTSDQYENALLYRRDLFYTVEYATTQTLAGYSVAAIALQITPTGGPANAVTSISQDATPVNSALNTLGI